jgi:hypothetical protein
MTLVRTRGRGPQPIPDTQDLLYIYRMLTSTRSSVPLPSFIFMDPCYMSRNVGPLTCFMSAYTAASRFTKDPHSGLGHSPRQWHTADLLVRPQGFVCIPAQT